MMIFASGIYTDFRSCLPSVFTYILFTSKGNHFTFQAVCLTFTLPGAGSSLKHCKFPSWSRHLPHFVGPAGSLPSLVLVLRQMNPIHTLYSCFLKIHLNIPSIPRSSQCSFTFTFPNQNPVSICPVVCILLK